MKARGFWRRHWPAIRRALGAYGRGMLHASLALSPTGIALEPDVLLAGPPPVRLTAPPPAHPERVEPDRPMTSVERFLWSQLDDHDLRVPD